MNIPSKRAIEIARAKKLSFEEESFCVKLAAANIAVDYWFSPFSEFTGPEDIRLAVANYVKDLDSRCIDGKSLCFSGHYGVGKTQAICTILKSALLRDKTAYYTSMSDLVLFSSGKMKDVYLNTCMNVDFLAIDEVDRRHFSSSEEAQNLFASSIERVLRARTQNSLPTLFATNDKSIGLNFEGQHKKAIDSLLSLRTDNILVIGHDKRGGK